MTARVRAVADNRESVAALPSAVDLNPQFAAREIPVRSQGGRGTCSVFAVIGALEFAVAQRRNRGAHLSPEFLNWAARRATGRTVDGGFFWELWRGFAEYGVCEEPLMPYGAVFDHHLEPGTAALEGAARLNALGCQLRWIKEWDVESGLTDEQFERVKRTLAAGAPVCAGLRWPHKPEWTDGVLHMREPHEVFDGHSVLLSGYRDEPPQPGGGVFLIRDSGAPERHGAFSYAYARTYMNDAAWVEPAPIPDAQPTTART